MAMIGISGARSRIAGMVSKPFFTGIIRSQITSVGRCASNCASPASPSPASQTVKPSDSSILRSKVRSLSLSSITRIMGPPGPLAFARAMDTRLPANTQAYNAARR